MGNKYTQFFHGTIFFPLLFFIQIWKFNTHDSCGGVKPRPVIEAQEHRFIKSTPEEEKSLRHVGNTGARKCPRRLVREEHPPRI